MKEKTIKYIINGEQKQFAINEVYTSIKEVKAELKNTSFYVPAYIEELNKLFKSKKAFFISKLEKYSITFNTNREWIQNPTAVDYGFSFLNDEKFAQLFISLRQHNISNEQEKLGKIIAALERIIKSSQLKDIAEFYKLEQDFNEPPVIICDNYNSLSSIFLPISEQQELKDLLVQLRKKLRIVLRFKYTKVYRDLRQSFRNLIRFLFKNMSDESGESNVLLYTNCNQELLTFLNQNTHEFRRNYQSIKIFT